MKKPKRGRPTRASKPSSERVEVALTPAELRALRLLAEREGLSVSALIRSRVFLARESK